MSSEQHRAAEVNRHLTVGEVECFVVSDGSFAYADPSRAFFANADREELRPALERHGFDADAWDTYVSPYPCLVVRTDDRTVLVDTPARVTSWATTRGNSGPTWGRWASTRTTSTRCW